MLIIKPIQDKKYQEEVCKLCGFNFDPTLFAYSEKENDKLIAGCQFDILGKTSIISGFGMVLGESEDLEALIILGRSVMNFLELSGTENCIFDTSSNYNEKYAKALGFKLLDGKYQINLKGLFDSKCSHCK